MEYLKLMQNCAVWESIYEQLLFGLNVLKAGSCVLLRNSFLFINIMVFCDNRFLLKSITNTPTHITIRTAKTKVNTLQYANEIQRVNFHQGTYGGYPGRLSTSCLPS